MLFRSHKESTVSKEEHQKKIDEYEGQIRNNLMGGLFSNANFAMDKIPRDTNIKTASLLFNDKVAQLGLDLINENGALKLKTNEGTDYFVDNKAVTPQMLADQLLTDNRDRKSVV